VAENRSTPLSILVTLLNDPDSNVRIGLSFNPSLPTMFLTQLAVDENPDVRLLLAENSRLPQFVLEILSRDENPYVSRRAFQTLERLAKSSYTKATA
jgi:hypothetical protein